MCISGRVFDRVSKTVPADFNDSPGIFFGPESDSKIAELTRKTVAWECSMRSLAECMSTYPTGQDLREVYWQSLICNCADYGEKASSDVEEGFNAWRATIALK
jgi:hypothetical protein